jgi:hypothetical protein
LTIREAALVDVMMLAVGLTKEFPDDGWEPVKLKNRLVNMVDGLLRPHHAPAGVDPRHLFPMLTGLYPTVVGCVDVHVERRLCEAVADVLAAEVLTRPVGSAATSAPCPFNVGDSCRAKLVAVAAANRQD